MTPCSARTNGKPCPYPARWEIRHGTHVVQVCGQHLAPACDQVLAPVGGRRLTVDQLPGTRKQVQHRR